MAFRRTDEESRPSTTGSSPVVPVRHALRDQDALWVSFLKLAASVVDSLEKSIEALCEARFDSIGEVENEKEDSAQREVQIEIECLRILALYEPVASDMRRMATVLKANGDWERIAELAFRIARRALKHARRGGMAVPEELKQLARDVLSQVRASYVALVNRDSAKARTIIADDAGIDAKYKSLRKVYKAALGKRPDQLDAWLRLMNTARNLERIADHAVSIAQTVIYLEEGLIIRHTAAPAAAALRIPKRQDSENEQDANDEPTG